MKNLLLIFMIFCSTTATAGGPRTYESVSELELAQIQALEEAIKSQIGLNASVKFTSGEWINPRNAYNHINDITLGVSNLMTKDPKEKILGKSARQVVVEIGLLGYYCEAFVRFKGTTPSRDAKSLVILHACSSPFMTDTGERQDTDCFLARHTHEKQQKCGIVMHAVLPTALYIRQEF